MPDTSTDTGSRYSIGERAETGHYPVSVDDRPAGYIYRWHRKWYAGAPGFEETQHTDRDLAADHLVKLLDGGAVAAENVPEKTPGAATGYVPQLSPRLQPTPGNILNAAKALARLHELGWEPLEGYPGTDNPWRMRCLLCGWKGTRWWSHLRGRNGDNRPRPACRHDGCIPQVEQVAPAKLAELVVRAQSCPCKVAHPTTAETATALLKSAAVARRAKDRPSLTADLSRLLGPCPAGTARAAAIEAALTAAKA
ncbi:MULTISPECIES: hypothetical protein [unclassified Streptomyces]|uniref:hypothetical protein n=1 Tax=unclassified Streptomyces TaxID=2593676 RepID=UPI0033B8FF88